MTLKPGRPSPQVSRGLLENRWSRGRALRTGQLRPTWEQGGWKGSDRSSPGEEHARQRRQQVQRLVPARGCAKGSRAAWCRPREAAGRRGEKQQDRTRGHVLGCLECRGGLWQGSDMVTSFVNHSGSCAEDGQQPHWNGAGQPAEAPQGSQVRSNGGLDSGGGSGDSTYSGGRTNGPGSRMA